MSNRQFDTRAETPRPAARSFVVGPEFGDRVLARRGGGRPIPARTRTPMENSFGADFGGVRLHTDTEAARLSTGIGARAFTYGRDIYFARGSYAPESDPGRRLLAHELTHVVEQQREGNRVQRAVGFEFEDDSWTVFTTQPGKRLIDPERTVPGTPAPPGSELTDEEEKEQRFPGRNIWAEQSAGDHINNLVGRFNLQTAPKKGLLHQGKHYRIEPDGPYSPYKYGSMEKVTNRMALEVVTDPFPETPEGYRALEKALKDIRKVYKRLDKAATGPWDGRPFEYERFVGQRTHGFTRKDVYLYGGAVGGTFKPQVTGGIRLSDLPAVFRTLGAEKNEDPRWRAYAAPMRRLLYSEDDPNQLANKARTAAMGESASLARAMIDVLVKRGRLDADLEGLDALEGFVSLALLYMTLLSETGQEGIKMQLTFLSRHPMSELWKQIPAPTRLAVRAVREDFLDWLHTATRRAVDAYLHSRYEAAADQLADRYEHGLDSPMLYVRLPEASLAAALTSFTRRTWMVNLMNDTDLLTPAHLASFFHVLKGQHEDTLAAYGKSMAIYLRGHGNVTRVRPVPGQETEQLAILENRAAMPQKYGEKGMRVDDLASFATQYFRWLWSIRNREPRPQLR